MEDDLVSGFGWNIGDLFGHSWRPVRPSGWFWKPKPIGLGDELYPAREEEVRRWGYTARKIARVPSPKPLVKSFVEITQNSSMSRDQQRGHWFDQGQVRRGGMRRIGTEIATEKMGFAERGKVKT